MQLKVLLLVVVVAAAVVLIVILLKIVQWLCTRAISNARSFQLTNYICIMKANRPVLFKNTIIIQRENHKHATSEKGGIS